MIVVIVVVQVVHIYCLTNVMIVRWLLRYFARHVQALRLGVLPAKIHISYKIQLKVHVIWIVLMPFINLKIWSISNVFRTVKIILYWLDWRVYCAHQDSINGLKMEIVILTANQVFIKMPLKGFVNNAILHANFVMDHILKIVLNVGLIDHKNISYWKCVYLNVPQVIIKMMYPVHVKYVQH